MPTLRMDMSVGLLGDEVGRDDFDENFFELVLGVLVAKLVEGALDKDFTGLNDADSVAELFDLTHDVGGKDDGFATIAAFADESRDGTGSHDIQPVVRLIQDHYRWLMHTTPSVGSLLH